MPSCYVCGRTRNQMTKFEDITFHKFPSKETVRDKWKHFVLENKLNVQNINKYSVICSKHFVQACFVMLNSIRFLVENAMPTIIISRVKGAKNLYFEEVKHLNHPILCPGNEHKSSFDVMQTLVKVPIYGICGEESISDMNISFSNTNTSIYTEELKDQISSSEIRTTNSGCLNTTKKVSVTMNVDDINECGVMPLTP